MNRTALVLLAAFASSCGDSSATDAGSDVPTTADAPTSADTPIVPDAPGVDASPVDGWASWGQAFFQTYCVECHAGPPSGRDYRTIDDVRRDAARIRCGTAPSTEPASGCGATPRAGMFPVGDGPFPSDDERRRLLAWIDAGLRD